MTWQLSTNELVKLWNVLGLFIPRLHGEYLIKIAFSKFEISYFFILSGLRRGWFLKNRNREPGFTIYFYCF